MSTNRLVSIDIGTKRFAPMAEAEVQRLARNTATKAGASIMTLGDSLSSVVPRYDPVAKINTQVVGAGAMDWLTLANWSAGSPFDVLGSAATSGFTAEQILATHVPTVEAARPTYCVCLSIGANNLLAGGEFEASALLVSATILDRLQAVGTTPILCTLPPVNTSNLSPSEMDRYNAWVERQAQLRGLPFVDLYSLLVDAATGGYRAGLSDDTLHPNAKGTAIVAAAMAGLLTQLNRTGPRGAPAAFNPTFELPYRTANVLLKAASGIVPTGWQRYGAQTGSLTPRGGVLPGNVLTMIASGGNQAVGYGPVTAASVGDLWQYDVLLGTSIPEGGWVDVGVVRQDGANMAYFATTKLVIPGLQLLTMRGIVSPGAAATTGITPVFVAGGVDGSEVRIALPTLRNLSAMNIPLT